MIALFFFFFFFLSFSSFQIEYLHNVNNCRTLFATHYHELTSLRHQLARLSCHTIEVQGKSDDIVFLYKIIPGVADRSYGIQVAQLAGNPVLCRLLRW
jgi:DNA mismatch repair protein MutS